MTTTEHPEAPPVEQPTLAFDFASKEEQAAGHRHVLGQKCDACLVAEPWRPYNGARSFSEFDRYVAADRVEGAVNGEMSVFDMLLMNVRSAEDLDPIGKANAIARLAVELEGRIAAARTEAEAQNAGERALAGPAVTDDPGMVSVFKDTTGAYRWMAIHTNKFKDREGEIFAEAAHKEFVDWVNETGSFPALRIWHLPMDIGRADFVTYDDEGFVVSSGTFNKGFDDVAEKLMAEKGLGCSHGYLYRPSDLVGGVYKSYRTYEVSVLPNERAANTLTAFFAGEEFPMLNPAAKAFLEKVGGPERARAVEENVAGLRSIADERGLSYKDLEEKLVEISAKDGVAPVTEPTTPTAVAEPEAAAAAPTEPAAAPAAPAADPAPTPAADPAPTDPTADAAEPPVAPTPTAEEQADAAAAADAAVPLVADKAQEDFLSGLREAMASSVTAALEPLHAEVKALRETVEAQATEIDGLKASRDSVIADTIRPRVGPTTAIPASMAPGNLVEAPPEAKSKDAPVKPIDGYAEQLLSLLGRQPQMSEPATA